MKKALTTVLIVSFLATSCASVHTTANGDVPPGQMKKITGSKSAKEYAPGQQNKSGSNP